MQPLTPFAPDAVRTPELRLMREGQWWPVLLGALVVLDATLLALGGLVAYAARFGLGSHSLFGVEAGAVPDLRRHFYSKALALDIALTLALFTAMSAYGRRFLLRGTMGYRDVFKATAMATLLAELGCYFYDRHYPIARGWLLITWLAGALLVSLGRSLYRRSLRALHRRGLFAQPVLLVGAGRAGAALEEHVRRTGDDGWHPLGFVDDRYPIGTEISGSLGLLGHIDDLPSLIRDHDVEQVLMATADLSTEQALSVLHHVVPTRAEVVLAPDLFRTLTTDGQLIRIAGDPMLLVHKVRIAGFAAVCKRSMDILGAAALLVVSVPIWIVAALAVRASSPGQMLVRQATIGLGGRPFQALKFRTTRGPVANVTHPDLLDRRARGLPVRSHEDLTPPGAILRRFSLDALPQLLNVLAGQMSLVGPAGIVPEELALYPGRQVALLTVRPGLTGVCQVFGRGALTLEERLLLDAEYVRTYSIWRDLQVLAATIPAVARGRGVQ